MDAGKVVITTATQTEIVYSLSEKLKACYVFPEIAEQICVRLLWRFLSKPVAGRELGNDMGRPESGTRCNPRFKRSGGMIMRNPFVAGLLSLLIPGLGQIYGGEGSRGAAILAAAIVIGSLNLLFLPLFVLADPDPGVVWTYWIPRIGHDVVSLWSVVFWIWAVVDAYRLTKDG
jgi:TM2 domain-containing membrane protein YozV